MNKWIFFRFRYMYEWIKELGTELIKLFKSSELILLNSKIFHRIEKRKKLVSSDKIEKNVCSKLWKFRYFSIYEKRHRYLDNFSSV